MSSELIFAVIMAVCVFVEAMYIIYLSARIEEVSEDYAAKHSECRGLANKLEILRGKVEKECPWLLRERDDKGRFV